jgi:hypothetical protein
VQQAYEPIRVCCSIRRRSQCSTPIAAKPPGSHQAPKSFARPCARSRQSQLQPGSRGETPRANRGDLMTDYSDEQPMTPLQEAAEQMLYGAAKLATADRRGRVVVKCSVRGSRVPQRASCRGTAGRDRSFRPRDQPHPLDSAIDARLVMGNGGRRSTHRRNPQGDRAS